MRQNDPRTAYARAEFLERRVAHLEQRLKEKDAALDVYRRCADANAEMAKHFITIGGWPMRRHDD
jgi:hypothetical protein